MTRTTGAALAAVLALAAGCSGGGDTAAAEAETHDLKVVVAAAESGFGCTQSIASSGLDMGRGSRLTVTDEDGSVVGTGEFDLQGAAICVWEAESEVGAAEFYRFEAGGELATVSRDELVDDDWTVILHIGVTGHITAA